MQFSWHFCRKLAASVCVSVFVFARRLFELQYARGQQVILWAGHLLYTLPPPLPPLPLTCLLHLFPLLYLFGIFFSLVSACLVLFFFFFLWIRFCTLRFSHLFGAVAQTSNILPLPGSLLLLLLLLLPQEMTSICC